MALVRIAATVGGYTMVSRILGFVRDILIAATLGTGMVADAFFVAFKLPNFFRRLFAEGAFSAGFVPLFSSVLGGQGREQAKGFAEETLSVLLVVLLLVVVLFEVAMPWLMYGLAPGFADEPRKFALTVALTRLTFPYLLLISLVSLLSGVLNSLNRFAAAAAAPILLNLAFIIALTLFAGTMRTPGHALAWAVSLAGVAQFVWLVWALRRAGLSLRLPRPRLTPRVKRLLTLMLPAAIGAGVVQINLVIDVILASFLKSGSVSYLFYADRLYQLPLGVVGVAVGTALLPTLSRQVAAGEAAAANGSLNRAFELSMLLTFPAAAALMIIPHELVGVLFQRGAFTARATDATAAALAAYAVGLPAYVLVKVLTPAFYGRLDTRTPVIIAGIAVVANVILSLMLMGIFAHVGLAMATAIASWLNVALLTAVLYRRRHFVPDKRLAEKLENAGVATVLMAIAILIMAWAIADLLRGDLLLRGSGLALLVLTGIAIYGLAALAFRVIEPEQLGALSRRRRDS